MIAALQSSGVDASAVDACISAASGVPVADDCELDAISAVLGSSVAVTAPKAAAGECLGAGASINVFAAAVALQQGMLFPTAGLERPLERGVANHVMGKARMHQVDYCVANACTPGATYGSIVLGRVSGSRSRDGRLMSGTGSWSA